MKNDENLQIYHSWWKKIQIFIYEDSTLYDVCLMMVSVRMSSVWGVSQRGWVSQRSAVVSWCMSNNLFNDWSSMVDCWCRFWNNSVESMDIISGVVNSSDWAIRFDQRVLSLDNTSVTGFNLAFNISGVWVLIGEKMTINLLILKFDFFNGIQML